MGLNHNVDTQIINSQLYLNENGNERLLTSLSNYSDIKNQNWVTYPASFSPLRSGSEFSVSVSSLFTIYYIGV